MRKVLLFSLLFIFSCILSTEGTERNTEVSGENSAIASSEYQGVELNIIKAEIVNTKPKIFGSPETTQMKLDGYILIVLEMKNKGNVPIQYRSTSFVHGPGKLSLDDNLGGHYYRIITKEDVNQGMIIYPGETGLIKLGFQKPYTGTDHLILSFPKYNIWGKQAIELKEKDNYVVQVKLPMNSVTVRSKPEKQPYEIMFGEEFKKDGILIKVTNVQKGRWIPKSFTESIYIRSPEKNAKKKKEIPMIAISYQFKNDTETKKIDWLKEFKFNLIDEFDNEYRKYKKSIGYDQKKISDILEHFPSIHPGESFEETIFFEVPIERAKYITLMIDASNIGIQDTISVKIPVNEIGI